MAEPRTRPPRMTTTVPRLPDRAPNTHKGETGHVAIVAGSRGMTGAAILSGWGALRGGAGLVRVLTTASAQPVVATTEPCLMTIPLPETPAGDVDGSRLPLDAVQGWADALAIGPGLGVTPASTALVWRLLRETTGPLVIDADGLNVMAQGTAPDGAAWWTLVNQRPTVITPHPGEMARLRRAAGLAEDIGSDDRTRLAAAHEYARRTGVTVVLKGHRTVVCTADEAFVNTTGNPGMATGGMGDVLTGLIAALLAQGQDTFAAARLGVYTHGLAGDHCAQRIAPAGYLARELADALAAALAEACRPAMGFATS